MNRASGPSDGRVASDLLPAFIVSISVVEAAMNDGPGGTLRRDRRGRLQALSKQRCERRQSICLLPFMCALSQHRRRF